MNVFIVYIHFKRYLGHISLKLSVVYLKFRFYRLSVFYQTALC